MKNEEDNYLLEEHDDYVIVKSRKNHDNAKILLFNENLIRKLEQYEEQQQDSDYILISKWLMKIKRSFMKP